VLGLSRPCNDGDLIGEAPPATIGEALKKAREMAFNCKQQSASWDTSQHYGRVSDKLVAVLKRMLHDVQLLDSACRQAQYRRGEILAQMGERRGPGNG
jgi:hypothetical protein